MINTSVAVNWAGHRPGAGVADSDSLYGRRRLGSDVGVGGAVALAGLLHRQGCDHGGATLDTGCNGSNHHDGSSSAPGPRPVDRGADRML